MFVLVYLLVFMGIVNCQTTGTIKDIEHIVIFMQENRAYDHYYGSHRGVRGYNDRAAPLLPSGRSPFYQPLKKLEGICGCSSCDIGWTHESGKIKRLIMGLKCSEIVSALQKASPPIAVKPGEQCSSLLTDIRNSKMFGINMNQMINPDISCPSDLNVRGIANDDNDDYMLPYPLSFEKTSATCMPAPEMDYTCDTKMWNNGNMDAWCSARNPGFGMSFFNRTELPYYYALADSFTIGDQYFQSTFTATCPNRQHLFTGSNGLSVPGSGWNMLDDSEPKGLKWKTMGEVLEAANISWKVYQQHDNFDDNAFAWFDQYREAKPGDALYDKGMARSLDFVKAFADDVSNDSLPQVSWLVGPASLSEHAEHHPQNGEDLSARILKILSLPENKKVYSKTAFILNYDEGGQFYDHHWVPTPPKDDPRDGKSTVSTVGELTLKVRYKTIPIGTPIGLGFRVPLFIISPWTRGDYVYSEVCDHTSIVKFIEKRFDVHCPNISPWRRAITGDLTAAFDFTSPDYSWPDLPDTSGYPNASNWQCKNLPMPTIPKKQTMPVQEEGTKLSRALPYEFEVIIQNNKLDLENLTITINNTGKNGAAFNLYDRISPMYGPRKYTVEAGKNLQDDFSIKTIEKYDLSLHGPNGFVRQFSGSVATASLETSLKYDIKNRNVTIIVESSTGMDCDFKVVDNAYEQIKPSVISTTAKQKIGQLSVDVSKSGSWYDLSVSSSCIAKSNYTRRFMGRMETGETTTSDPAMAKTPNTQEQVHPLVPHRFRHIEWDLEKECKGRRMRQKDLCWPFLHDEL